MRDWLNWQLVLTSCFWSNEINESRICVLNVRNCLFQFHAISTLVTALVCWTYPERKHDHDQERCYSQTPRNLGIVGVGMVRPDRSAVRVAGDHRGYDGVLLRCVSSWKFNSIQSGEPPLKSSGKGEVCSTQSPPVEDV